MPAEVLNATYEAALRELITPGSLSPDFVASQQVKSESIGPISTTYQDSLSIEDVRPVVSIVNDLMSPIVGASGPTLCGSV